MSWIAAQNPAAMTIVTPAEAEVQKGVTLTFNVLLLTVHNKDWNQDRTTRTTAPVNPREQLQNLDYRSN